MSTISLNIGGWTATLPVLSRTKVAYQPRKSTMARFEAEQKSDFVAPTFKASPAVIRRGNKLMQTHGFCYLRIFACKYREYTARRLGINPKGAQVEAHLATHAAHRRGDNFILTRITGPFQAHIYRSRYENRAWRGDLSRYADCTIAGGKGESSGHRRLPAPTPMEAIEYHPVPEASGDGTLQATGAKIRIQNPSSMCREIHKRMQELEQQYRQG